MARTIYSPVPEPVPLPVTVSNEKLLLIAVHGHELSDAVTANVPVPPVAGKSAGFGLVGKIVSVHPESCKTAIDWPPILMEPLRAIPSFAETV